MRWTKRMRRVRIAVLQGETTVRNQLALKITFTMQLLMLFTSAMLLLLGAQ